MNLVKKIWHDENSEPPKNYLWAKEGKLFKYIEGQWKEISKKEDDGEEGGKDEGSDLSEMKWYEVFLTLSQEKPVAWVASPNGNGWEEAELIDIDEYSTFDDWKQNGGYPIYALYSSTQNGIVLRSIHPVSYGTISVLYDEGSYNWREVSVDGETYYTVCPYI